MAPSHLVRVVLWMTGALLSFSLFVFTGAGLIIAGILWNLHSEAFRRRGGPTHPQTIARG